MLHNLYFQSSALPRELVTWHAQTANQQNAYESSAAPPTTKVVLHVRTDQRIVLFLDRVMRHHGPVFSRKRNIYPHAKYLFTILYLNLL